MIPQKTDEKEYDYPDFQPDQILTSDDLNHLFNFLDVQERLTRTNLIGIGILCGMQVTKAGDGKSISITKGTGITSHGYLIVHGIENSEDPIVYKKYRNFVVPDDKQYELFLDSNQSPYNVWEIIDDNHKIDSDLDFNTAFLADKVVLFFYEILKEKAKNCDPTSCDDKGVKVYVNVRKFLLKTGDAAKIIEAHNKAAKANGTGELFPDWYSLKDLKIPRFDVPATELETTEHIFDGYQKIFTKTFIKNVGDTLNAAFAAFKPVLKVADSPFKNFVTEFAFLHKGQLNGNELINIQYYYDFFSDIIIAYNEWKASARVLKGMCTPPEALFPQHLFPGELNPPAGPAKSKYRTYFIPSPFQNCNDNAFKEFEALYKRLDRLIKNFKIPQAVSAGTGALDGNIRITPSLLGNYKLGQKALPFYYTPKESGKNLFSVWNPALNFIGKEDQVLNYIPWLKNNVVINDNALVYDLEPYNFFRVEGHIGKKYTNALATIQKIRDSYRLPFDTIAVSVDTLIDSVEPRKFSCHFNDLNSLYVSLRASLLCQLCKAIGCIYPLRFNDSTDNTIFYSEHELIPGCKDELYYYDGSVGFAFEKFFTTIRNSGKDTLNLVSAFKNEGLFGDSENLSRSFKANNLEAEIVAGDKIPNFNFIPLLYFLKLINQIIQLAETFSEDFYDFDYKLTKVELNNLKEILDEVKENQTLQEIFKEHPCLHILFELCELSSFGVLAKEYAKRIKEIQLSQSLKEFAKKHSGLQHKAGVPVGGTFILVYRDAFDEENLYVAGNLDVEAKSFKATSKDENANEEMLVAEEKKASAKSRKVSGFIENKYEEEYGTQLGVMMKEMEKLMGRDLTEKEKAGFKETFDTRDKGTGKFAADIDDIDHGTVIADFYLPYLCCSDCSPIQFVVNIPPPKITLGIDTKEFCDNSKGAKVVANPLGGVLTTDNKGKDVITQDKNGLYSFNPDKVVIPDGQSKVSVAITYVFEDQSQLINVIVYRKPVVQIVAKVLANPLQYEFDLDKPEMITSVVWNFGDNKTSTDINPPIQTYSEAGQKTITATVKNVICESVVTLPVEVKNPDPVVVIPAFTEICQDAKPFEIVITPAGGTITGEDSETLIKDNGGGKYLFDPTKADLLEGGSRQFNFTYTSLQGTTGNFSVLVHAKPYGVLMYIEKTDKDKYRIYYDYFQHTQKIVIVVNGNENTYEIQSYNFTLDLDLPEVSEIVVKTTLINGTCTVKLDDRIYTPPKEFVCPSFKLFTDSFMKTREIIEQYDEFKKLYGDVLPELSRVHKEISQMLAGNQQVPYNYFSVLPVDQWVSALPVYNNEIQLPTFSVLDTLTELFLSITCQGNDKNGRQVWVIFSNINYFLISLMYLSPDARKIVERVLELLYKEKDRLADFPDKAYYLTTVENLITNFEDTLKRFVQ
jgi:PKD repeat protein